MKGKENYPIGDADRPRQSDGVTLWIDTRGDRTGHRATRTCHQFHFLAAGGGPDKDEPAFVQTKIHRALQDAPLSTSADVPFRFERIKGGYRIEAFLSANVLTGFDPEQYPRLGVFYAVRDFEKGEQTPGADSDFPFAEDPSLWASLELVKGSDPYFIAARFDAISLISAFCGSANLARPSAISTSSSFGMSTLRRSRRAPAAAASDRPVA